jgi:hypothetical protein
MIELVFYIIEGAGFSVAAAIVGGGVVYLSIKMMLAGVRDNIRQMSAHIVRLEERIKDMDNDIIKIDTLVSMALDLPLAVERIGRADGRDDKK